MNARSSLAVGLVLGLVAGFAGGYVLAAQGLARLSSPEPILEPCEPSPCPPAAGTILDAGRHHGYVVVVDPFRLYLEVVHNEHWGIAAAYLYDPEMSPLAVETPPVLHMMLDGESVTILAGLENWDGEEDGGWHFEDDALLGQVEYGRWRITLGERVYSPLFQHVHLDDGHGAGHGHEGEAEESAGETESAGE